MGDDDSAASNRIIKLSSAVSEGLYIQSIFNLIRVYRNQYFSFTVMLC